MRSFNTLPLTVWMVFALMLGACSASDEQPNVGPQDCSDTAPTDCAMSRCVDGEWLCDDEPDLPVEVACEEKPEFGTACGETCGDGRIECDADDAFVCVGESELNACGGCEVLTETVGDECGECGTWTCSGTALVCDEPEQGCCVPTPGPCLEGCSLSYSECFERREVCNLSQCYVSYDAEECTIGDSCRSGNCSFGFCAPHGFSYAPAGTFTMGAPLTEPGRHTQRENGQHEVTLTKAMFVKQTTVTQGEWEAMFGSNPSYFANCGPDCPVERVNLFEMFRFANLASEAAGLDPCYTLENCAEDELSEGCPANVRSGLFCANNTFVCDELSIAPPVDCNGYRVPTEAEWEYFARAGTDTAFLTSTGLLEYWGVTPLDTEMDLIAWYAGNSQVAYETAFGCELSDARLDCALFPPGTFYGTHPVAQKAANAWGLYDITGNVWERVWDVQASYPEPGSMVTDPTGPAIDQIGMARAMRGGTFDANGQYLRVAYRTGPAAASRFYNTGFRLVRSIIPEPEPEPESE